MTTTVPGAAKGPIARLRDRPLVEWLDTAFVPLVFFILFIWLSFSTDVFFTQRNLENVLSQMVILAIVAFGSTFVILTGDLDLSVGAGTALISVVIAKAMTSTGSVTVGVLAGLGAGILLGLTNGFLVAFLGIPAFIATLGTLVILRGLALQMTDGGVVAGLPDAFEKFSDGEFLGQDLIVWMMVAVFLALLLMERKTSFALKIFAVGGNRDAARIAGVRVAWIRLSVFVLSGFTTALAGLALTARVESGQPNASQLLELFAIAAIVMGGTSLGGGRGSVAKTAFGVGLIVVLRNGLDIRSVKFDTQQIIIGAVFIAAASVDFVRVRASRRAALKAAAPVPTTPAAKGASDE